MGCVLGIPELKFGFAAGFQAGDFLGAGVIPCKQLPGCDVEFAIVEIVQELRRGQSSCAEVEDEVDQGIELALG
jgi:hypothetical protein